MKKIDPERGDPGEETERGDPTLPAPVGGQSVRRFLDSTPAVHFYQIMEMEIETHMEMKIEMEMEMEIEINLILFNLAKQPTD